MKPLLCFLLLYIPFALRADSTRVAMLRAEIHKLCPEAEITDIENREGFTEIEFLCNGNKMEAGFDGTLQLVYKQREVSAGENVYNKIIEKLNKSHPGWSPDDFNLVETPDTSFYVMEMEKNGIESEVYFTLDGKYYRPLEISAGEGVNRTVVESLYNHRKPPYNFLKPDKIYELPDIVREISGIVLRSETTIYIVQDELGAVFEYDLQNEKISGMVRFTDEGDFEDVATDETSLYVLRSDGTIFIFNPANPDTNPEIKKIPVEMTNLEGLFYDTSKHNLLLAGKNKPVNADEDLRLVYNIQTGKMHQPERWLQISVHEINKKLEEHYPMLPEQHHPFSFNPSAIAVHPLTGETYILSASDRLLAVYSGVNLQEVIPLPAEIYNKPEGLAFSDDGVLYISSEGIKNGWLNGRIFVFRRL